ncbi:MAG: hypothetical protein P4L67_00115 [Candidatus Pacebacteria bacterium]|nr:hypothetical protein [Candidatus Paceibacterota bacterium]
MQIAPYVSERHRRRRKVQRYLFATIGVFALYFIFLGVAWFFMRAPIFRVQHVVVTGNATVQSADVTALLQADPSGRLGFLGSVFGWGNMFTWPDKVPAQNLKFIPQLAAVAVSKDYFSHTITLNVTERVPYGIWCFVPSSDNANEQCYWFDSNGILFERSLSTQGNLIYMVNDRSQSPRGLNGTVLPAQFNGNFLTVMDVLRQTGLGIGEIDLKDLSLEEVDVATTEGPRIEFSLRFPATDYLSVLKNIIGQSGFGKLQYVDCRTEDRVFYK